MSGSPIIRPAGGNIAYEVARLAAGESRVVTDALQIEGFRAQLVDENETEAIVDPLPHVSFLQIVERRPTMQVALDGPVREIELRQDSLIVVPPGIDSRWASRRCGGLVLHTALDSEAFARWTQGEFHSGDLRPAVNLQDSVLTGLAQAVTHELRQSGRSAALYLEALAIALAVNVMRVASRDAPSPRSRGGLAPWQLRRATDLMLSRQADDLSLTEIAAAAGLSPHHFARAFKQSTGLPPHAWLTRRRIERAQEMILAHPALPLIEVAFCVGYASQTAFGAAFRRVVGATPAEWRRSKVR